MRNKLLFPALFCLLMLCLMSSACVPTAECDTANNCGTQKTHNSRFEFQVSNTPIHESSALWLKANEEFQVKWDAQIITLPQFNSVCDFCPNGDNTGCHTPIASGDTAYRESDGDCIRTSGGRCATTTDLILLSYKGFVKDMEPGKIAIPPDKGCVSAMSPVLITPSENASYQLVPSEFSEPNKLNPKERMPLVEKRVFVVQNQIPQPTAYELKRFTGNNSSGLVWYYWTMTDSNIWADNFSAQLRVGKVRILKGYPSIDGVSGRLNIECAASGSETPCPCCIAPSEIKYIPLFTSNDDPSRSNTSCHADGSVDGNIDLIKDATRPGCRPSAGATGNNIVATPTYFNTILSDELTWFVAFAPGSEPALRENEILAIEFEIETI